MAQRGALNYYLFKIPYIILYISEDYSCKMVPAYFKVSQNKNMNVDVGYLTNN